MIPDGPPEARRAFIEALYAAYAAGDPGPTLASMADDIDFEYVAPTSVFAFGGRRVGKEGVAEATAAVAAEFSIDYLHVQSVMLDGDDAVVRMKAGFTTRATGAKVEADLVDVATIKDGKIVRLQEFFDTEKAAVQAFGQSIVLGGPATVPAA